MSNLNLIQINPHSTKPEEYAAITANARIKIQARKRIGTRDDDGTAIIEKWWVETDLLAYLPAWDLEDIQKGRDYGVFCTNPRKGGIVKTRFGIITFKSLSPKLFIPTCLRNHTS